MTTADLLMIIITGASVVVAFGVGICTILICCRQAKIVAKQSDIMEQQNKIALFEKRLDVYNRLLDIKAYFNYFIEPKNTSEMKVIYMAKTIFQYTEGELDDLENTIRADVATLPSCDLRIRVKYAENNQSIFVLLCNSQFLFTEEVSGTIIEVAKAFKSSCTNQMEWALKADNHKLTKNESYHADKILNKLSIYAMKDVEKELKPN